MRARIGPFFSAAHALHALCYSQGEKAQLAVKWAVVCTEEESYWQMVTWCSNFGKQLKIKLLYDLVIFFLQSKERKSSLCKVICMDCPVRHCS